MQETESAIKTTSMRCTRVCSLDFIVESSIAFAHHEVQTAKHRGHVTNQATGQKLGQDTEVHERWRTNFQPVRNAASSAVDVKAKLTFGIFCAEIDFAGRRVEPFCHHDEVMD